VARVGERRENAFSSLNLHQGIEAVKNPFVGRSLHREGSGNPPAQRNKKAFWVDNPEGHIAFALNGWSLHVASETRIFYFHQK
jgi:hypothetical protein